MFFMSDRSRLGLAGVGACVLGLVMCVGALGFYPHPAGSNVGGGAVAILFLALFFIGELIGLFGLGVLIYLGIYKRQRRGGANSYSRIESDLETPRYDSVELDVELDPEDRGLDTMLPRELWCHHL